MSVLSGGHAPPLHKLFIYKITPRAWDRRVMLGKSSVAGESAPLHRDRRTYCTVQYRRHMAGRYVLMARRAVYDATTGCHGQVPLWGVRFSGVRMA